MAKRILFFTSLILSMVCSLAACQVSDGPVIPDTPEPTQLAQATLLPSETPTEIPVQGTVSIWHSWDETRLPILLSVLADFQSVYPDVQFDVFYVPSLDLQASFAAASIEGRAPDILIAPGDWGPELYSQGWVADLSSIAPSPLVNSLNPAAVEGMRYRNSLTGLPVSLEGVVLYHNQRIIPISPPTLDDLISSAKQATTGDVMGAYFDRSFFFSGGHLEGIGGSLMDEDGMPAFNDQKGLEWIELLRGFEFAGPTEFFGDQDVEYFKENRAGFIMESTKRRDELKEALGSANLVIDPWPVSEAGALSGYLQSEAIYINPRVMQEDKQIAWMIAESLLSPKAQSELAEAGLIPAATPETFSANQIVVTDDLVEQAMLAFLGGTAYPGVPEMPFYPPSLDTALGSIFNEGISPEQALQSAEDDISAAILSLRSATPVAP